jgi:hypothetical protein
MADSFRRRCVPEQVVGWVESSEPTLSLVGSEDSTHPTWLCRLSISVNLLGQFLEHSQQKRLDTIETLNHSIKMQIEFGRLLILTGFEFRCPRSQENLVLERQCDQCLLHERCGFFERAISTVVLFAFHDARFGLRDTERGWPNYNAVASNTGSLFAIRSFAITFARIPGLTPFGQPFDDSPRSPLQQSAFGVIIPDVLSRKGVKCGAKLAIGVVRPGQDGRESCLLVWVTIECVGPQHFHIRRVDSVVRKSQPQQHRRWASDELRHKHAVVQLITRHATNPTHKVSGRTSY